jgi:hypothetical protein
LVLPPASLPVPTSLAGVFGGGWFFGGAVPASRPPVIG